jgi:hypothetical protein
MLLRAFGTALPPRRPLCLQLRVMPREPDVCYEVMKLGQGQHCTGGAWTFIVLETYFWDSMKEKSVKIGCRKKKRRSVMSFFFTMFFLGHF